MPRKPRFYLPGVPVHVVQRGNNRGLIFFAEGDYPHYLDCLKEAADRYACKIHAYVLMSNHVHILASPENRDSISRMMQYVGRRYVPYINHTYERSGTLWEGRYKGSLVQDDRYLLACMRYIELNPVRAKMVKTAAAYRWSSYAANASGRSNPVITPHSVYLALGKDAQSRRAVYKAMFRSALDSQTMESIRSAWQTGTPLGNERFKQKIEKTLKMKVGYARRGRPRKEH
ncbi:MAG: transposase [Gammaproteobacteria bacterium]|nr:transposase [Gammaproteobacteria bacterium]